MGLKWKAVGGMCFFLSAVWWTVAQAQILPFYETVPKTSFSCQDRTYGYYADTEVDCQVFHICPGEWGVGHFSFLCPNQTVFNQAYLVCDHPYNVECSASESLYSVNDNFGVRESASSS